MTFYAFLLRKLDFLAMYKKSISLFFFTIFYAGYLALGGFIFCQIEGSQEDVTKKSVLNVKLDLISKYPGIPEKAIDELFNKLTEIGVKGIVYGNATAKWTFGNSFLFSSTLLTTIGYGHLSPVTAIGKVVCVIYTSIGIPITILFLDMYVEKLIKLSNAFKANLFRTLGNSHPFGVRFMHVSIVMSFSTIGIFVIPSYIFELVEVSWSYLDAIYFCFISLTTIGLGDFVPGVAVQHPKVDLYRFGATVYLFIGVTVAMFMVSVGTDFLQNYNKEYKLNMLPVTVIPERVVIKNAEPPSYGTIVMKIEENINIVDENSLLLPR